jgi:hypothetical protein
MKEWFNKLLENKTNKILNYNQSNNEEKEPVFTNYQGVLNKKSIIINIFLQF